MARHSHWHQIRLKKGAEDRKRGKIFTKHAHLIEIAARKGGDPEMNASLRIAIENARADNMPRENIERAIKKGTGELAGGAQLEEITYEGYGPGGVAFFIDTLTDNKNRTSQMIRNAFQKHGGSLGGAGSTSYLFENAGVITLKIKKNADEDALEIIDAGANDIEEEEGMLIVYTAPGLFAEVKNKLLKSGFEIVSAELRKIPKTTVEIKDAELAGKTIKLFEALDEQDDVSDVFCNSELI